MRFWEIRSSALSISSAVAAFAPEIFLRIGRRVSDMVMCACWWGVPAGVGTGASVTPGMTHHTGTAGIPHRQDFCSDQCNFLHNFSLKLWIINAFTLSCKYKTNQ